MVHSYFLVNSTAISPATTADPGLEKEGGFRFGRKTIYGYSWVGIHSNILKMGCLVGERAWHSMIYERMMVPLTNQESCARGARVR